MVDVRLVELLVVSVAFPFEKYLHARQRDERSDHELDRSRKDRIAFLVGQEESGNAELPRDVSGIKCQK
jgi:hypothetical protein